MGIHIIIINITTTFLYYTYKHILYNSGMTETQKDEYNINDDDDVNENGIPVIMMNILKEKEAYKKGTNKNT